MSNIFQVQEVLAAYETASSTSHNVAVAWPYVVFSVFLALSLIGIALKILRNQTG
jgi:hypothetical protein